MVATKQSPRKKKGKEKEEAQHHEDAMPPPPPPPPIGEEFAAPVREVVKPSNQLQLTEAELEEEIPKMLNANNPEAPKNIARWNKKEGHFKWEPMVDQTIVHYQSEGWMLHHDSDEARRQQDLAKMEQAALDRFNQELAKGAEAAHSGEGGDGEGPDDSKQLRNQFNFSDRAAQTFNQPPKDQANETEPPPTASYSGACSQFQMYDEYVQDQQRQRLQEELNKQKAAAKKSGGAAPPQQQEVGPEDQQAATDVMDSEMLLGRLKVVERMVNQNTFNEMSMDFKYWEDEADRYRKGEGTLLPLWKFHSEKAKRRDVTSLCWNPKYLDMFAAAYGSFDYLRQSSGCICVWTLKNPSFPEYTFTTDSGVLAVDFHPEHPHLLAAGCYDGTVLVFDVRAERDQPLYRSTVRSGKNTDPVWQVAWQPSRDGPLQFYSVSSDGHISKWVVCKALLVLTESMELRADPEGDDTAPAVMLSGGCCLDLNKDPAQSHLYLVGTEDGRLHKCSKAYTSEYLCSYTGHNLAVYACKWSLIHPNIFLSASADWTVKLWDSTKPDPLMTFDLHNPVGDAAWAPYSSCVFAAVTDDGKVAVFDISVNKHEPLCEQKVVKKAKLTRIAFNPQHPIILVGDDRGCVTALKLSPNLRCTAEPEEGSKESVQDLEMKKLNGIIEVALKSKSLAS